MAGPESDERLELVYAESQRALTEQQGVLNEIRSRGGTLLSATAIATSFLGAEALKVKPGHTLTSPAVWLALAFFVATLYLLIRCVLWPQGGWVFRNGVAELLSDWVDASPPRSIDDLHRDLAGFNESHYIANKERIDGMFDAFRWASVMMGAEILCWLLHLVLNGRHL